MSPRAHRRGPLRRDPVRARRRGRPRALLAVALALVAAVALGGPARASAGGEDAVRLSTDGSAWAADLTTSLFGADALVVPGATVVRDLWVRNDGPGAARVLVDLAPDVDPAQARTGLGAWLDVALDGTRPDGATWRGPVLDPGEATRVEVRVAMSADAPSSTRRSVAGVLESVHLVAVADGAAPPGGGRGSLPRTGADAWAVLAVAALAAGAGVLLARAGSAGRAPRDRVQDARPESGPSA
ncbi:hypothetical protein [Cellulosimicrobium composti]|uniref:LPXTG cell wall anchor domain-containing protein n=1 Tax=Cellulosimicrobium composti TaxID=2672572 RepID=A0ABX0BCP2_9MICO|nr:hypothetical protein [Cellulosimicrobium composti]NDO89926.1 hypothetical protein [Cellulosimicrobium composti]